jgi:quinol monooxygenase YgiN
MTATVEATQRNEIGTLNYEWAISDDRQVCHIYERFQDSAAAMTHLESFGANFAPRFMEVMKPTRLIIYGTPSAQGAECARRVEPRLHGAYRGL